MDDVKFLSFYILAIFRKSTVVPKRAEIAHVCMVTTVNICKVIFLTTGLNNFLNCAALN